MSNADTTPPADGTPPAAGSDARTPGYSPPAYSPPPAYNPPPAYAPPAYGGPAQQQPQQPPTYGAPAARPGAYGQQPPAYGQQHVASGQQPPAYGQQPAYAPPGYPGAAQAPSGQGSAGYPGVYGYAGPKTNVLAILSLVASGLGLLFILPVIGSVAGVIMGHLSLRQIARTGERGRGVALAGTIIGWIGVGAILLFILLIGFAIAAGNASSTTSFQFS
ncbi:DUF4190 domain-containing protein [Microbacterium wangruii]|uniref:DUF4190 domain-containing protein n=1 Tax=Microbacterium wangruii TaxID=3049073 RepID=UPI00256EB4E0|nr:DUF4190 domain-containing protein [Microbacterium sp. zg-Y1211]MDL5486378.1 DUF4190 domain-containing protein [Microbacterium sp. zg-Y1211]